MHRNGTTICSNFFICSRVAVVLQLVSTYCQSGRSISVSESRNLLQAVCLQTTSKTATIQYKPVTSLASNNNELTHYKQSCGYNQIYPIFMACKGTSVISLTSYPYTVCQQPDPPTQCRIWEYPISSSEFCVLSYPTSVTLLPLSHQKARTNKLNCQAISPTNGLGMRLTLAWTEDSRVLNIQQSCLGYSHA